MAEPFLSEIRIMSFNFAPKGWALCNGQLLPINQNQGLFSLLGTTYGGNGQTTFGLPELRGRVAIHEGNGHTLGEKAGSEAVTINSQTLPTHNHQVKVFNDNANATPAGNFFAAANNTYQPFPANTNLAPNSVTNTGGSQPHTNQQPFTVLSFCIALQGIFPSQT
ncbi:MAG TPA: tail fiber protein [Gaiellaceae bacterium]